MAGIDVILDAAVDTVKKSGVLDAGALMGTVSAVGADGTLTVTRGADTYPRVRVVGSLVMPAVADIVEIFSTAGGWICVGALRSNSAPRIQSGTAQTPASATDGTWQAVTVTFPVAFAATPTVTATAVSGVGAGTTELNWSVNSVSATDFQLRCRRTGPSSVTTLSWIATDL